MGVRGPRDTLSGVRRRVVVTVSLIAALGCMGTPRLYPGPARPDSEVAEISASRSSLPVEATAERVDGVAVSARRFQVMPGPHVVATRVFAKRFEGQRVITYDGRCELEFWASAGERYSLVGTQGSRCAARLVRQRDGSALAECRCNAERLEWRRDDGSRDPIGERPQIDVWPTIM